MMLYFRMIVTLLVSFFTSRLVLQILGVTDFGIYNLVGGLVVLFSFLSSALLSATQRYLNFSLGKQDEGRTNEIFCTSMNSYLLLSVIVILLAESIGIWFVNTQLKIPAERMYAANWVFQISVLTFVMGLIRVPYNAVIISYEKMDFYAYLSFLEVGLKLVVLYLLYIISFDKLILYTLLYAGISLLILLVYKVYCNRYFCISTYKRGWNASLFRELFGFSSWSLLGSLASVVVQQGVGIIVNVFYGVTLNAALGLANYVSDAINGFVFNFQTAFKPQIVKLYASNQMQELHTLMLRSSKFSFFMMFLIAFPAFLCINPFLEIWLDKVPAYTGIFCRIILLYMLLEAISAPFWMYAQATGNIKNYQIIISSINLMSLPLGYSMLVLGLPVYFVLIAKLVSMLFVVGYRLYYMSGQSFPLSAFYKMVLIPALKVSIFSVPIPWLLHISINSMWLNLMVSVSASIFLSISFIFYCGITETERVHIKKVVYRKLHIEAV